METSLKNESRILKRSRYRTVFVDSNDRVTKIPNTDIENRRLGKAIFPGWLNGKKSTYFNENDYRGYCELKKIVPNNIVETELQDGIIYQNLVRDYNGKPSLTLREYVEQNGSMADQSFWKAMDNLFFTLANKGQYFFDIKPHNIMIKKSSDGTLTPILIDFKRVGHEAYPLQLHLRIKKFSENKFRRRYARFKAKLNTF